MPTKKMKPCPFCGESNEDFVEGGNWISCFKQFNRDNTTTGFFACACTNCGMQQCTLTFTTEEEAIRVWNIRAESSREKGLLEALKYYADDRNYIIHVNYAPVEIDEGDKAKGAIAKYNKSIGG